MKQIIVFVVICAVNCWSSFHKSDKAYTNFYEHSARPLKECKNKISDALCDKYEEHCNKNKNVLKLCKKTCGDCPAASPMSCRASKYGCCWDNITTSGPNGNGCPPCEDRTSDCKKITDQCSIAQIQRTCPQTCGICLKHCYDDMNQMSFCPLFKSSGFCEIDPKLMFLYCKKTCNLCQPDSVEEKAEIVVEPHEEKLKRTIVSTLEEVQPKTNHSNDDVLMEMLQKEVEKELRDKETKEHSNNKKKDFKALSKEADEELTKLLREQKKKEAENALDKLLQENSKKDTSSGPDGEEHILEKANSALLSLLDKKTAKTSDEYLIQDLLRREKIDLSSKREPQQADSALLNLMEKDQIIELQRSSKIQDGDQKGQEKENGKADAALLKLLSEKKSKVSDEIVMEELLEDERSQRNNKTMHAGKNTDETRKEKADEALFKAIIANNKVDVAAEQNEDKMGPDEVLSKLLAETKTGKHKKVDEGQTSKLASIVESNADEELKNLLTKSEDLKKTDRKAQEKSDEALLNLLDKEIKISETPAKKELSAKDEVDEALLKLLIKRGEQNTSDKN